MNMRDFTRSQMFSRTRLSMCWNKGTWNNLTFQQHLLSSSLLSQIWAIYGVLIHLSNQIQTEMIFDIPPQAFREISCHLTLINSTHCCPPLPLIISHSLPERLGQPSFSHPPLYIPHLQLHCLFLWSSRVQEDLMSMCQTQNINRKDP